MSKTLSISSLTLLALSVFGSHTANARDARDDAFEATSRYLKSLVGHPEENAAKIALFANQMPKGGDIHHHTSGAVYVEDYLNIIESQGYCVYTVNSPEYGVVKYTVESGKPPDKMKAWCLSAGAIKANEFLYRDLMMSWSDIDYTNHFQLQSPPDLHFFDTFPLFGETVSYDFNGSMKVLKKRAIEENVQYIETMLTGAPSCNEKSERYKAFVDALNAVPPDASYEVVEPLYESGFALLSANSKFATDIGRYLSVVGNAVSGLDDDAFACRIQAYVFRGGERAAVFSSMYAAFVADATSDHVVGVNIVGPENGVVAMRDYSLHMKMFHFFKKKHPEVRLSLHAGELAPGMVAPEGLKFHIREAIEVAGAQRVGHGIDIASERAATDLLRLMKEKDILVEINLTSNQFILGVRDGNHPITIYRQNDIAHVISTDDPGVSRNTLSKQYEMLLTRYALDYSELKKIVRNSISYGFLTDEEKKTQLKKLEERFARFERATSEYVRSALSPGTRRDVPRR